MSEIPAKTLEALKHTHEQGCQTLQNHGEFVPESVKVAIEVERHRWYWRPKKPRLLLVAESHVLTTEQDMEFKVDQSKVRRILRPGATLPPDGFVRFVYCLAYGESDLLRHVSKLSNPGTALYWDIFGRVAFRCPQPRKEDGVNFDDRMRWKIPTLRQLYTMGIWLLDASVHAIYLRNGNRLPTAIRQKLHQQWWDGYGRLVLQSCDSPMVWVIGKTVYNCLAHQKDWRCRGWIYQPSAPDKDLNCNWPRLLKDCCRLLPRRLC